MKTHEVKYFCLFKNEWCEQTTYISEFDNKIHITLPQNINLDTVTIKEVEEE